MTGDPAVDGGTLYFRGHVRGDPQVLETGHEAGGNVALVLAEGDPASPRDIVQDVNYYVGKSKFQIDLIDMHLSKIYGFTDEETDFIVSNDIKYRMGGANDDE